MDNTIINTEEVLEESVKAEVENTEAESTEKVKANVEADDDESHRVRTPRRGNYKRYEKSYKPRTRKPTAVPSNKEIEYESFLQTYTCENGKCAKIFIPKDATEDDLLAIKDMLDTILRRRFKINF